jgi:hypothetical protein
MRKGTIDQFTVSVGQVSSSTDRGEICETGGVVVQQTVTIDLGMVTWHQAVAWMFFGLTLR